MEGPSITIRLYRGLDAAPYLLGAVASLRF